MTFSEFERAAREAFEEIPEEFKVGIDGLTISQERPTHPNETEVFTLGECLTESFLSEWEGPETTRSRVVLYWGSFRAIAGRDPEFDWDGEIWETLTHELRHHLESLASEDALEQVDYAMGEEFKRFRGADFDPFYYRQGDSVGKGVFRVEKRAYLELEVDPARGVPPEIEFEWGSARWAVPAPDPLLDVNFLLVVWPEGASGEEREPPAGRSDRIQELEVVLVRRVGARERLTRLVRRMTDRTVGEWEAPAERRGHL